MNSTIRTLIVDDEAANRENLNMLLAEYCPQIEVVAEADSVQSAFELIRKHNPELVFLDIRMPKKDGFQLLEAFEKPSFELIFVTAYDEYALKAIKFSALDYLLKPIDIIELTKAVDKASNLIREKKENIKLRNFLHNRKHQNSQRIVLPQHDKNEFIEVNEISHLEGENNYTKVFLQSGKSILVSKSLKEYERLLSDFDFIRIHRSYLVNPKFIKAYLKNDGARLQMQNGNELSISRQKQKSVLEQLKMKL